MDLLFKRNLSVLDKFWFFLAELVDRVSESYISDQLKPSKLFPTKNKGKRPNHYHARSANDASLKCRTLFCQRNAKVIERTYAQGC